MGVFRTLMISAVATQEDLRAAKEAHEKGMRAREAEKARWFTSYKGKLVTPDNAPSMEEIKENPRNDRIAIADAAYARGVKEERERIVKELTKLRDMWPLGQFVNTDYAMNTAIEVIEKGF